MERRGTAKATNNNFITYTDDDQCQWRITLSLCDNAPNVDTTID